MNYITDETEILVFEVNSLYERLGRLRDQRRRRGIRYPLEVALTMIIMAKLAGEDEAHGMATWLKEREGEICRLLCFGRRTTPAASTIGRILAQAVCAVELDEMVGRYLQHMRAGSATVGTCQKRYRLVVTLDGKTLRGTIPVGQSQGLHLLAAYLPGEEVVLMQVEVAGKEKDYGRLFEEIMALEEQLG